MTSLDKQLRKLAGALRTLDGTEGRPIARRNARKRVLGALRVIRASVDADFPAIVSREGVKRLTVEGRIARLKRQGWSAVTSQSFLSDCAIVGIRIKRIDTVTYAPNWARLIWNKAANDPAGDEVKALRAVKNDRVRQQAALAEAALLK